MEWTGLMKSKDLGLIVVALLWLSSCDNGEKGEQVMSDDPPVTNIQVPPFNADSAFIFIQDQVEFGPRIPNSRARELCADYMIDKLSAFTPHVITQEFDSRSTTTGELYKFQNIIGRFNPEASRRILLAAHWDTRLKADKFQDNPNASFDGANDGGSGVGVLLEIARNLVQLPDALGVDIIFFDAEDQGGLGLDWCLGSKHWTANKHLNNYSAYYGILLDMVGAKNATFCQEYHSMQFAPKIQEKVWNEAHQLGYSRYFLYQPTGAVEDDHYYVNLNARIPMIDIIDAKPNIDAQSDLFKDYHHRPGDNMEVIDKQTLEAVGTTVLRLLYKEASLLM